MEKNTKNKYDSIKTEHKIYPKPNWDEQIQSRTIAINKNKMKHEKVLLSAKVRVDFINDKKKKLDEWLLSQYTDFHTSRKTWVYYVF